ncbi:ABC transporter permease [Nocardiopsis halotolerans]|uniref:ABC transporter permease n=1 Tax=Nocardiopsis halotolerans TaxID=124252 RepID=UPI00034DEFCC|nr:ABC-2 family transporter protein [Nocardiopsis halotolerans]
MLLFTNLATTATTMAVMIFLWRAVFSQSSGFETAGFNERGITTYVIAAQLLTTMQATRVSAEISNDIARGSIAVALVRPVSYPISRFALALPVAFANTVLVGVPVVLFFSLMFPVEPPALKGVFLFITAALSSLVIAFCIEMLIGTAALLTVNTWGVGIVVGGVVSLFSGALVPVDLMPDWLAAVASALPFQSMVYGPVNLLMGRHEGGWGALAILGQQWMWAVIMVVLCTVAWRWALAKIEVQGG